MGFTVALNGDLKDEDARYIADAIRLLRGVQSVTGLLSSPTDYINRTRIKHQLADRLWQALAEPFE
jgi:hypothetical protein